MKCEGTLGFFYFAGMIGSLVYFLQQAPASFGHVIWSIIQCFAWPGILVYQLFNFLH